MKHRAFISALIRAGVKIDVSSKHIKLYLNGKTHPVPHQKGGGKEVDAKTVRTTEKALGIKL